jgi:hypothetical protein
MVKAVRGTSASWAAYSNKYAKTKPTPTPAGGTGNCNVDNLSVQASSLLDLFKNAFKPKNKRTYSTGCAPKNKATPTPRH